MELDQLLSTTAKAPAKRLALFAYLSLGVLESLSSGMLGAADAVRLFFNATNCLFVRKSLRHKAADEMSRGVQLPDLFDALPADEANREFRRELAAMHALCLNLLEGRVA